MYKCFHFHVLKMCELVSWLMKMTENMERWSGVCLDDTTPMGVLGGLVDDSPHGGTS